MNKGIIYFIQPSELIGTFRYKIGCSANNDLVRCKTGYKKGSRYLCIMECYYPFKLENIIKEYFSNNFSLIAGSEYFEGDENTMLMEFVNIVIKYINDPIIDNIVDDTIINYIDYTINILTSESYNKLIIDTKEYVLLWFNDNFKLTNNKNDFVKLKYIYDIFITSNYYKQIIDSKKKYTKKNFINDFEINDFFSNYYCKNNGIISYYIHSWILNINNEHNISTYKNLINFNGDIITWFKDTFELTENKDDTLKVKDIYNIFTKSTHYENMTKTERKKYNKTYFVNYFETNKFFLKYFCSRCDNIRSIIKCWKIKEDIYNNDNQLD